MSEFKERLENLDDLIKIQCADGNWNHDPYMHGMANGLLLARSIFDDKCPDFLEAPNEWLEDMDNPELIAVDSD